MSYAKSYPCRARGLVIPFDETDTLQCIMRVADTDEAAKNVADVETLATIHALAEAEDFEDVMCDFGSGDWTEIANALPNTAYFNDEDDIYRFSFDKNANVEWASETPIECGVFVVLLSDLDVLYGSPYKTLEDVVNKYREFWGKYLPEDFDIAAHLGEVAGSYWVN